MWYHFLLFYYFQNNKYLRIRKTPLFKRFWSIWIKVSDFKYYLIINKSHLGLELSLLGMMFLSTYFSVVYLYILSCLFSLSDCCLKFHPCLMNEVCMECISVMSRDIYCKNSLVFFIYKQNMGRLFQIFQSLQLNISWMIHVCIAPCGLWT